MTITCSALTDALLESELFGTAGRVHHVRSKARAFRTADGGTIFLDEIGEMPGCSPGYCGVLED